jgi:pimeloyl-ACP methyl ester carboxylesterase
MNTTIYRLSELNQPSVMEEFLALKHGAPTPVVKATPETIVFVHGIRSNHTTFQQLANKLDDLAIKPPAFQFAYFDYDYGQSIAESGRKLAVELKNHLGATSTTTQVTIVGHSMGGLVGRLALLQHGHEMTFVKRLVMLGTPNHGTLHTGHLGLFLQFAREVTGKFWALTTQKTGVKELTEIDKLLKNHLNDETRPRTYHTEYVSIPATCFHEGVGWLELMTASASRRIGLAPLAMELFKAHPCWSVGLERPHDGIVEESSVYLGNRDDKHKTRRSERRATCAGTPHCGPYIHVRHDDLRLESHVTIQTSDRTAAILAGLFKSPTIKAWRDANAGTCDFDFEPLDFAALAEWRAACKLSTDMTTGIR